MKTRNYGIDFLRMISMIMIVMLHTLGHGGILRSVSFLSVHYQIAWLLEVIAFGAVNTYAMISGFVSVDSHFKISNILILWLQVLFYGILINTVFFFLLPESRNTSCSRSKFLSKLLKTFDKTFREIFPVFISTKRREKPSAFFDNNFVNNAYFSEAASSSSSHLASSSSKAPISSRMTCLCLWSS